MERKGGGSYDKEQSVTWVTRKMGLGRELGGSRVGEGEKGGMN